MADTGKEAKFGDGGGGVAAAGAVEGKGVEEEEERLLGGMAVLDFDMLCSTVAMQTQGKWRLVENDSGQEGVEIGGVFRMWEGEILDCFDDRRVAAESVCCPCYRFGKNMRRAGFASCFLQGTVYAILALSALLSCIAFTVTRRSYFLYLGVAFSISIGMYLGFFRTQMRKKFNIRASDSPLDDCVYHLICPCCTLCQASGKKHAQIPTVSSMGSEGHIIQSDESRTLEMNNVQDGTWHGRGDTICVGTFVDGNKAFLELHPPPPPVSAKPDDPCELHESSGIGDCC